MPTRSSTQTAVFHRHSANPTLKRFCHAWQCHAIQYEEGHCEFVYKALNGLYESNSRHYHDSRHILSCLKKLDEAKEYTPPVSNSFQIIEQQSTGIPVDQVALVELALWFHDAIFTAGKPDNESRSAHLFEELAVGHLKPQSIERINSLITATEHRNMPRGYLEQLMVDIDLSSFSLSKSKFLQDGSRIRQEFDQMSDEEFVEGQTRFLTMLLERKSIYSTPYFHARYEARARRNIIDLLQMYEGGFTPSLR